MARTHGRLKVSIWDDPDFIAMKRDEQHAYFLLMSNKGLSRCGVIDFIPSRFESLAADLTDAKFRAAVAGLQRARFVVVDKRTQELLLRSHVRHDGVFDRANMGKAVGTAYEAVVSRPIRQAIGDELARLMNDSPDLPGWVGLAMTSPEAHAMARGIETRSA
jgi:hypothetical protein